MICAGEGCDRDARARGLCLMHYKRAAKTGELPPKAARPTVLARPCSVDGCGRDARAKGMCNRHYENQRLRGDPVPVRDLPLEQRLRYEVTPAGCWEYAGARNEFGYGVVNSTALGIDGKRAHRLAYELWVGPIPDGLMVRHSCDNPPCINPDHLSVGTQKDNMADAVERDRVCRGEARSDLLTAEVVLECRRRFEAGERVAVIAADLGVARTTISSAVHGHTWSHV